MYSLNEQYKSIGESFLFVYLQERIRIGEDGGCGLIY